MQECQDRKSYQSKASGGSNEKKNFPKNRMKIARRPDSFIGLTRRLINTVKTN